MPCVPHGPPGSLMLCCSLLVAPGSSTFALPLNRFRKLSNTGSYSWFHAAGSPFAQRRMTSCMRWKSGCFVGQRRWFQMISLRNPLVPKMQSNIILRQWLAVEPQGTALGQGIVQKNRQTLRRVHQVGRHFGLRALQGREHAHQWTGHPHKPRRVPGASWCADVHFQVSVNACACSGNVCPVSSLPACCSPGRTGKAGRGKSGRDEDPCR